MSRRREANRIESIVRGVGALFLILVLAVFVKVGPGMLKGKTSTESLSFAFNAIYVFLFLSAARDCVYGMVESDAPQPGRRLRTPFPLEFF